MRPFNKIYSEPQHYSAFKEEPSTPSDAIANTNIFFNEIVDDLDFEDRASQYEFLTMCYRHSASQFIMDWKADKRTFKQFLEQIYNSLYVKEQA